MSVKKSLYSYLEKQLPKKTSDRKKRCAAKPKNKSPEKLIVKEILVACRLLKFSVEAIEAKAVYNPKIGRYISGQVKAGYSDISGCTNLGHSVYIEVKARGKLSTLKPHQKNFLINKINSYAFAVCVDDAEEFKKIFSMWQKLFYSRKFDEARDYLTGLLPKVKGYD